MNTPMSALGAWVSEGLDTSNASYAASLSTTTTSARIALALCPPVPLGAQPSPTTGPVKRDRLGGVLHEYYRAAA
jgi:hypothetical protein